MANLKLSMASNLCKTVDTVESGGAIPVSLTADVASTSTTTGTLTVTGGVGITGSEHVGGALHVTGGSILVGPGAIDTSAILQAKSTTKGFLPPVMTATQFAAIASPAAGLIVYDSTNNVLKLRTNSAWVTITTA